MKLVSDKVKLNAGDSSAVFIAVRHVDILKIKGLEFHHLFLLILARNPETFNNKYAERLKQFYDTRSRDESEENVKYYTGARPLDRNILWETTISASSECGYDPNIKNLGQLIKVPNFDRLPNAVIGERIYTRRIAVNDPTLINKILEFEHNYKNSLSYSLIPEISSGYNSNSFFRGVLEYIGLSKKIEVPSCFKAPGLGKSVKNSFLGS